jgi:DNA modification methylase
VQKEKYVEINKCYNENCLDTMSRMPDCFVDLTVTSPPYDNLRAYNGYSFDFEAIAKELFRVTKQGGVVVWVVGDATIKGSETGTSFRQALEFVNCGFNLHDTMIYQKDNPPPVGGSNRYYQHFEYMFVFSKGRPKTFKPIKRKRRNKYNDKRTERVKGFNRDINGNFTKKKVSCCVGDVKIGNIWKYVVGGGNSVEYGIKHPATFPEQLANDHIISWSNEGDLVYDPFMGSGTTAKMAIINKRNWIGSEISDEYCKIIERRITTALT